jgi:hypothetical protein
MTEVPVQTEIISKLENADWDVRVAALEAITALAPYCESYHCPLIPPSVSWVSPWNHYTPDIISGGFNDRR